MRNRRSSRKCPAVTAWLRSALVAESMQGHRHDFLARPVLTRDENVCLGRPHSCDQITHRLHGARFGNELWTAFGAQQAVFRLQALSAAQRLAEFNLGAKNGQ